MIEGEYNSNAVSARRIRIRSRGSASKSHRINTESKTHPTTWYTPVYPHSVGIAREHLASIRSRSVRACPGSTGCDARDVFTNQRTRNNIRKRKPSTDFNYQPRDLEMRNNFAAKRNPNSRTFTFKSQATTIQNTTR